MRQPKGGLCLSGSVEKITVFYMEHSLGWYYRYINVLSYYSNIVVNVVYVSSCNVYLSHLQNIYPST